MLSLMISLNLDSDNMYEGIKIWKSNWWNRFEETWLCIQDIGCIKFNNV